MDKISEITRRDIVDIIKSGFSVELDERNMIAVLENILLNVQW